jgi:hypothetical protein
MKHLDIILKKMCEEVGADFEKIDFKKDRWFLDYTWSEEDEEEYTEWLTNYLYKNQEARKELTVIGLKNKKRCRECAKMFVFNYGWKIKPENEVA